MPQLLVDVNTTKNGTGAAGTVVSNSFSTKTTAQALFALIGGVSSGATVSTVTGGGLTWTRIIQKTTGGAYSEIWSTYAPTILNAVTVTATSTNAGDTMGLAVLSFINADTSAGRLSAFGATNSASATSNAPSVALTTTRAGSYVIACGNDFSTGATVTAGAGQTLIYQYQTASSDALWATWQTAGATESKVSVTSNSSLSASDAWNIVAVEVLAVQMQTNNYETFRVGNGMSTGEKIR